MLGIKTAFTKISCRILLKSLRKVGFGNQEPADQLLIFKPDRIGDFILATGVIHTLCREFGAQKITLAVSAMLQPLAAREFPDCQILPITPPRRDECDFWPKVLWSRWSATRRDNRGRGYAKLINLRYHQTILEDLLLGSFRAANTCGIYPSPLGNTHWSCRLRSFIPRHRRPYPAKAPAANCSRELEAHRQTLELVLNRPATLAEVLPSLTRLPVKEENYLLIVPFGSERIRDYSEASMVEGVRASGMDASVPVILCGEVSRKTCLESLAAAMRKALPNPVALVHPAGLLEFVDYVAKARCVISLESAAAHIAAALDKRGVFILGGGHFGFFAPWERSSRQKWLYLDLPCFGCDWHCNQPYVRCIQDISATTVAEALKTAWNQA